ncbi:hypothetical protein Hypma_001355 [Hypsizygus marmoreus]|uniref:Secreted protein n=1 Tax=Hypsizygus marmoreus TaxID=39966 RepID=A0A369K3X5_HYPMA|nr:hypothetical protein Hypma_001355 [Hypsizygus marmoreus]
MIAMAPFRVSHSLCALLFSMPLTQPAHSVRRIVTAPFPPERTTHSISLISQHRFFLSVTTCMRTPATPLHSWANSLPHSCTTHRHSHCSVTIPTALFTAHNHKDIVYLHYYFHYSRHYMPTHNRIIWRSILLNGDAYQDTTCCGPVCIEHVRK